jgi:metallo-beta-lactamase class B
MTCAQEKRAQMKDGASNPFVKLGEFQTFVAGLAQDFDNQLAKQTDALQRSELTAQILACS